MWLVIQDLASAIDEVDVVKFTDIVKEYDSMSRIDQWKTTLLLRVKNALKLKEVEEPDLL
jgi:alpha-soluble NSF attachment protein